METKGIARLTVHDLAAKVRLAAEWLVGKFEKGSWPTQADFQVFCFDRDIPLDDVDPNRGPFFEYVHEANGPSRVSVTPWLMHDLGVSEPFDRGYAVFKSAISDMRRHGAGVTRSRRELMDLLKISNAGPDLWQLRHVLSKSPMQIMDTTPGEWSVNVPFRLLRHPLPTPEELLFPAAARIERAAIAVDVRGFLPSGFGWGRQQIPRRLTDWVFVASTWEDLKTYREAVLWALLGQKRLPLGMELWAPDGSRSIDRSMAELAKANLMILILGCRYGSPARDDDPRAFTEIEYDTAKEHGIDVLPFLADPSVAWTPAASDPENADKLKAFRGRLEHENHVSYYRSPDDLKFNVVRALNDRDER